MVAKRSAWRASDAARYEALCEVADAAIAVVLRYGQTNSDTEALADARKVRVDLLNVDGYDRSAVDAEHARLLMRLADLMDGVS